jgi:hypothetical protein
VLLIGYIFCSQNSDAPPRMNKVVAMANRYWALLRLSGCPTVNPSIKYEDEVERRIEAMRLPKQKWGRHFRAIGLTNLPRGNPGPKPRRRAARRSGKAVKFNVALGLAIVSHIRARAHQQQITMAEFLRSLIRRGLRARGRLTSSL